MVICRIVGVSMMYVCMCVCVCMYEHTLGDGGALLPQIADAVRCVAMRTYARSLPITQENMRPLVCYVCSCSRLWLLALHRACRPASRCLYVCVGVSVSVRGEENVCESCARHQALLACTCVLRAAMSYTNSEISIM